MSDQVKMVIWLGISDQSGGNVYIFSGATRFIRKNPGRYAFCFYLILIIYAVLLLPTVGRHGISWDEQTDMNITRSYLRPGGWFIGSDIDPSQTRLPMFAVAIVYTLLKTSALYIGRLVSCLMGALTLVAVYVYCKRDYNRKIGLLACFVLATSPFFLSFARIAFTETDIYLACTFAWLLVCMSILQERRTVGWATVTAVALGLALSSKFTAVVVLPVVLLSILSCGKGSQARDAYMPERKVLITMALTYLACAFVLLGWMASLAEGPVAGQEWFPIVHYALVLLCWVLSLVWAVRHRDCALEPRKLASFVITFALVTFVVVPPEHLTNFEVIGSMGARFESEMEFAPRFMVEATTLHIGSVIFKSGPVIGVGLLAAFVATVFQWKKRRAVRFPLVLALCYFLGLALLPIAQTFYMMPLLPILAVFGADRWFGLFSKRKVLAVSIGVLAAVLLIVDMCLCYPDYNLNGYQWLGARYLVGRSTIGYRSIVQTTSDGVEQVARWMKDNVMPGERVLVYLHPWHIVEAVLPHPRFSIIDGRRGAPRIAPDYVVCHINYEIRPGWGDDNPVGDIFQYPCDVASWHASYTKVFSVQRAFGIEVASVWKRE